MIQKPVNIYFNREANEPVGETKKVGLVNEEADSQIKDETLKNLEAVEIDETDFIPQSVYDNLPTLLKVSSEIFNDKYEKDVYLLGALSALSGCFHNLVAFNDVDKKKISPNLLTFIVAPAASGKGALTYAKKLIKGIKDTFSQNSQTSDNTRGNSLLIPANISSSGMMQLLEENAGVGVMIESEMDALINVNKQEWGNYSETLRYAFENEPSGLYRKTGKERVEIENTKLAVAISGTVNQFRNLMQSAENGLFSRGCYYTFDNTKNDLKCFGRMNCIGADNLDELYSQFSNTANDYYKLHLEHSEIKVVFSQPQLEKIQSVLQKERDTVRNIPELDSNIKRSFVVVLKLAALLAFLKECEADNKNLSENLQCSEPVLQAAMDLMLTSLRHSYKAYDLIPHKRVTNLSVDQQRLLSVLPDQFTRIQAVDESKEINVNTKTIDNYLKSLTEKGYIQKVSHGLYKKK